VLLAFTDPHDAQWNEVRERLWAASYGERDPETASASVPVFGAAGDCVGALTVSGPKSRLAAAPAMAAALAMLLPLAQKATVALGGAGARYDAQTVRDSLARFAAAAHDTAKP
jgi:DNA-binding IclR family transcriptional regulator